MKDYTMHFRHLLRMPLLFFALFFYSYVGNGQINWGPSNATLTDRTITINTTPEWVNIDMYFDPTGNTTDRAIVIVWDEFTTQWDSYYFVYDETSGWSTGAQTLANNAKHPDVIIGDKPGGANSGTRGEGRIGFVWEDVNSTQDVVYRDAEFVQFFGSGISPTVTMNAGPTQVSSGNDSYDPHIDAYADPIGGGFFTSNAYEPLRNFVMTWTEDNSGTNEIWVEDGTIPGGPNSNQTYIDDGERSDIAGVSWDDGSSNRGQAHLIYVDNSGYATYAEYNVATNSVVAGPTTLNGSELVFANTWPRIEAANVNDTNNTNKLEWMAVAQLDSNVSGRAIVESYDPGGTPFSYNQHTPLDQDDAWHPTVATGPGPDDYMGNSGMHGVDNYQFAWFINNYEFEALQFDHVNSPPQPYYGYYEINQTGLSPGATQKMIGVTSSSNTGNGMAAAWYNFMSPGGGGVATHCLAWKYTGNAILGYKPASVANIEGNTLTTAPNPTEDYVVVSGLNGKVPFFATDISGKVVLKGGVSALRNTINVSELTPGIYIFNFIEKDNVTKLKLVKQ